VLWVLVSAVVLVAVYRVSEELINPAPERKLVVDVPAGSCPTGLHPNSIKCEVNAIRRANGRRPLRTNHRLRAAARRHARDMVRRRYFAHVSPEGRNATDRVRAARYLRGARTWAVGEDIGWGTGSSGSPKAIVEAWMDSPPHRGVILNGSYREGGAGIARGTPEGGSGVTYVMDLAAKSRRPNANGWEDRPRR
jgi:hypothetical protein